MTRKQFLILLIAVVVLGGAGLALVWQDIAAYRASGARNSPVPLSSTPFQLPVPPSPAVPPLVSQ